MPPTEKPSFDCSSLNNDELAKLLRNYGVKVGPINAATRSTYERKLMKLKTGAFPPTGNHYQPVDDDTDDDEVEVRLPELKKRSTPVLPYNRPFRETESSAQKRSLPSLVPNRESEFSYATTDRKSASDRVLVESNTSIPLWLKLVALGIAVTLIYLIYINMEPQVVSNIPEIENKLRADRQN